MIIDQALYQKISGFVSNFFFMCHIPCLQITQITCTLQLGMAICQILGALKKIRQKNSDFL